MNDCDEVRTIGEHELTFEMNNIIDAVLAGKNIKGFAYAGAGKSTLLRAIEKYYPNKKGLYICYNKSLEQEARRFFQGSHVHIYTSHSYALNSFDKEHKFNFIEKVKTKLSVEHLKNHTSIDFSESNVINLELEKTFNSLIVGTINNFFSSASKELKEIHLSKGVLSKIDTLIKKKIIKAGERPSYYELIVKHCGELARKSLNPESDCPTTHDGYMKHWQLSEPVIDYDYIMFDEAQDSNPVLLSVILKQSCQQIFVGDKYQSIYQFRGGVNAMDIIPYVAMPLSRSFRYGQSIADLAAKILHKSDPNIEIKGLGFDTKIIKGSEYTGSNEKLLYVSQTNINSLDVLIECYRNNVPAILLGGKSENFLGKLISIQAIHQGQDCEWSNYRKYKTIEDLKKSINEKDVQYIIGLLEEEPEKANDLRLALEWSLDILPSQSVIDLATAHQCKGLEYDHIMLADDYRGVINAFSIGKPLTEEELNLIYVAVTRAKKTLIIPDELYDAFEKDCALELRPYKTAKHLLDNLLPKTTPKSKKTPSEAKTKPKTDSSTPTSPVEDKKNPTKATKSVQPEQITQERPGTKASKPKAAVKNKQNNNIGISIEVGQCKETNTPLHWKPTDTAAFLNPNIGIVGTMGTGKTQCVKSMVLQMKQQELQNPDDESLGMLIFDYKNDYSDQAFLDATGAQLLDATDLPINPFVIESDHKRALINTANVFVDTLTATFNLGTNQQLTLKKCIHAAYENRGIFRQDTDTYSSTPPTFKDVWNIYENQKKVPSDSLTKALSDLNENQLFESNPHKCKSLYDMLDGNIIVIALNDLPSSFQALVVALLLDAFYAQMQKNDKPKPIGNMRALKKMVLVDEADNFLSLNIPSLRKILKEGREFGVGMMLSTQGLDHFQTSDNSYADYMNGWIIHKLTNPKPKDIEMVFNISGPKDKSSQSMLIKTLEKHHSFFIDSMQKYTYQESTAFWKLI